MRDRLDAVGGEVKGLVDSVRAGADRLEVDLTALEQRVSELASTARNATKGPEATPAGAPRREETSAAGEKAARTFAEPAAVSTSSTTTAGRPAGEGGGGARDDDVEGARLIALNMALSGASREDTDKYMAENFDLPDRAQLLEEVYGSSSADRRQSGSARPSRPRRHPAGSAPHSAPARAARASRGAPRRSAAPRAPGEGRTVAGRHGTAASPRTSGSAPSA